MDASHSTTFPERSRMLAPNALCSDLIQSVPKPAFLIKESAYATCFSVAIGIFAFFIVLLLCFWARRPWSNSFLPPSKRSVKKNQLFYLRRELAGAILPSPDISAIFFQEATEMPAKWEKEDDDEFAPKWSAEEMEHFAHLRLLVRALNVSHERLAKQLGFVRPFDAQEALHGRRGHSADDIAITLLDTWRVSRHRYFDAARYMDSLLDDDTPE
jgi:hypothetical protein